MIEKRVIVEGRVQGVGFRATAQELAERFNLKGTVCNLRDGRVEIFVQGESSRVDSFLKTLHHRPGAGEVTSLLVEDVPTQHVYECFKILI